MNADPLSLRERCLELSARDAVAQSPEEVVKRAEKYYEFLSKGLPVFSPPGVKYVGPQKGPSDTGCTLPKLGGMIT